MKILIADDELRLRKVIALYMRKCGHTVVEAENGEEAIELACQSDPDVIILDVMMPKMTGIEATKSIRQNDKLKNKPIVLLTANAGEADQKAGIDAGASNYMTKPFSPKELLEVVEAAVKK